MSSAITAPKAFVIGYPINHSRSPLMHRYWLRHYSIDGSYDPIEVPPDELSVFLRDAPMQGFIGGNVTVPHKEIAVGLVDILEPFARRLGAVNTLWYDHGKWYGGNSDGDGFLANLDRQQPGWEAHISKATIIGAGGAARAVVAALSSRGISEFALVNRSEDRAAALAEALNINAKIHGLADSSHAVRDSDLLVNCSILGMHNAPELEIDLTPMPKNAIICDIVYMPLMTPLLRQATARGLRICDGIGMLAYQAVYGFSRWFGHVPEVTPELRDLLIDDCCTQIAD